MDVSSSMTTGTGTVQLDIDSTTASSAVTADSAQVTSQALTYTSGTLAKSFASTPQNQVVSGNQVVEIGRWKLTSSYQAFKVTELKLDPDVSSSSSTNAEDAIVSVSLWDGTTQVGQTESFNNINEDGSTGGYFFTGLNFTVPASTIKTLTAKATLATPDATNGTSGLRVVPSLTWVQYEDPDGTVSTIDEDTDGNSTYVYKAIPKLEKVELTNSAIFNGQVVDLYSFKVTAPSQGSVSIKQFKLDLSWSDVNTQVLELESLKLFKNGVDITTSVLLHGDADPTQTAEGTSGVSEEDTQIIVTWDGTTEDTISAGTSVTYTVRGTPQDFASTTIGQDSVALAFNADTDDVTFGSTTVDFIGFINNDGVTDDNLALFTSATTSASAEDANLIWSDNSAVAHSASRTAGTGDWTNSYLLDSLTSEVWSMN